MKVRRARAAEAPVLTDLCLRSKQSNGYDDAFMAACRDELTVTPADMLEAEYWVAEADAVCGCICLRVEPDGRSGEVEAFFVDPACQRQGVGRLLWETLAARARALGLTMLHLDADPAAVPFYRAMGFAVIGTSPSGSIPGRRLPHMRIGL